MKKAIHHLSRASVIALEIVGAIALVAFFAWVGLLWRLSQGPIELNNFIKTHLETAFHEQLPEFNFTVGDAQLVWGGRTKPFEFEMQHVSIARLDKTPVFALDRLRVQLSKRQLVFGRIVPRLVHLYGPELRVIRQEDGRFTLNVGEGVATAAPPQQQGPPAPAPEENRAALVRDMLRKLQERSGLGILAGLQEIDISDAAVRYEDRIANVSYLSLGSDITVARSWSGIVSTAAINLELAQDKKAALRATVVYSWEQKKTSARVDFTGVIPSLLAQQSDKLSDLAGLEMSTSGSINIDLDPDFKPIALRFAIGGDAGKFNVANIYEAPVDVKDIFAKGNFNLADWSGGIDQFKVDLGGPQATGSATLSVHGGVRSVKLSATLTDMPIDRVATYWPPALTPAPRWWVTTHLSKGIATKATLDIAADYNPADTEAPVKVASLGGRIDFKGIKVDYLPPLMPVKDVAGFATYDRKSFNLDIDAGKLNDMTVTKSVIHITDLDKLREGEHPQIDIAVALHGPLKTALKVIDSPPLKYPEMLGIKTQGVEGKADVNVDFNFPIVHDLALSDVKVKADARLKDVAMADMVAGMPLTGGPMDLTVDNSALHVRGDGKLAGAPVKFDWVKNFTPKPAVSSVIDASLSLDAATLLKFGVPKDMDPKGAMPATLTYTIARDKSAKLDLHGDIRELAFAVPQAGYEKHSGVPGQIGLTVLLKNGKPYRISDLDLKADGSSAKGDIDLLPGGAVKKAVFNQVLLGNTNVALEATNLGKSGYDLRVTGRQLDASPAFREGQAGNSDAEAAKPGVPLHVTLNVGRMLTGKNKALDEVRGSVNINMWNRIDRLQLDAMAGGRPLTAQYIPQDGGHALLFEADNAGQALSALGISNSIRNGRLTVQGKPRNLGGPRDLVGTAVLENFKLNDAPVVAKLLNALSLSGILSLLNGEGLSFKKAKVKFTWVDRGPPQQPANMRVLHLDDGQTSGASLGLTFEGKIDEWKNLYDLKGTIIPVSDINKLFSIIPILGPVLTGGGEGVIAATYTIKGPKSQPDVMVNPLSVLAPGILRKVFFEH